MSDYAMATLTNGTVHQMCERGVLLDEVVDDEARHLGRCAAGVREGDAPVSSATDSFAALMGEHDPPPT